VSRWEFSHPLAPTHPLMDQESLSPAFPRSATRADGVGRRTVTALLTGVTVLFLWKYFLLDQALFAGDTALEFLPFRCYLTERLLAAELPLWNPHLFGGTPALAEAQYQFLYPPNALLLLLGGPRGMSALLILHLLWLAVGTYRFCRRSLGLGRAGALLAAVAFTYGGVIQSRTANQPYPMAAAWLPWLLLAADQARAGRCGALLLPGLILALQLLTGAPQFAFYSLVLLTAYLLWFAQGTPRLDRRGAHPTCGRPSSLVLLVCLVVGMGLAAAQWLPQLELARQADRGVRASYEFSTEFSLQFHHLAGSLLFPKLWGTFNGPAQDGFFPGEELAYPGGIALALALVALAADLRARRRAGWFWLLLLIGSLFLALGRNNPIYPVLYTWVPGIGLFRAPARWLLLFGFALAILAGRGLDLCLEFRLPSSTRSAEPAGFLTGRRDPAQQAAALLLSFAVIAVGLLLSPLGRVAESTPQRPFGPWGQVGLLLAGCGVLALPVLLQRRPGLHGFRSRGWSLGVLGVLVLDLFVLSQDLELQHTLTAGDLDAPTETATQLRSAGTPDRFWAVTEKGPLERWQSPIPTSDSDTQFRARSAALNQSLMLSCVATQFRTYGLTGVWGALMPLRRHARPLFDPNTPADARRRWLRLLNVRYYLSVTPLADPELQYVSGHTPAVFRDPEAFPRAFWVGKARSLTGDAALDAITRGELDLRTEVALEGAPSALPAAPSPAGQGSSIPLAASLLEYGSERVRVGVQAPASGYLVLMDTPYPGWRARVDGRAAPILVANWMGRAVPLEAGYREVEFRFQPASVRVGFFLSLLTLGSCLAILAGGGRPHGRRLSSPRGTNPRLR